MLVPILQTDIASAILYINAGSPRPNYFFAFLVIINVLGSLNLKSHETVAALQKKTIQLCL